MSNVITLQDSLRDAIVALINATVGEGGGGGGGSSAQVMQSSVATYDFGVDGGAVGDIALTTTPPIPADAWVVGAYMHLTTPLDDAGGTAEASLALEAAGDLLPTGFVLADQSLDVMPSGSGVVPLTNITPATPANWLRTTEERSAVLTVAVEALTAGVFTVLFLYMEPWD